MALFIGRIPREMNNVNTKKKDDGIKKKVFNLKKNKSINVSVILKTLSPSMARLLVLMLKKVSHDSFFFKCLSL